MSWIQILPPLSLYICMYLTISLSLLSPSILSLYLSLSLTHSISLSQYYPFPFFSEKQVILKVGVFLKWISGILCNFLLTHSWQCSMLKQNWSTLFINCFMLICYNEQFTYEMLFVTVFPSILLFPDSKSVFPFPCLIPPFPKSHGNFCVWRELNLQTHAKYIKHTLIDAKIS